MDILLQTDKLNSYEFSQLLTIASATGQLKLDAVSYCDYWQLKPRYAPTGDEIAGEYELGLVVEPKTKTSILYFRVTPEAGYKEVLVINPKVNKSAREITIEVGKHSYKVDFESANTLFTYRWELDATLKQGLEALQTKIAGYSTKSFEGTAAERNEAAANVFKLMRRKHEIQRALGLPFTDCNGGIVACSQYLS